MCADGEGPGRGAGTNTEEGVSFLATWQGVGVRVGFSRELGTPQKTDSSGLVFSIFNPLLSPAGSTW